MTDPYREMIPLPASEKKISGLIIAAYTKPHRCNPPTLNRFWRFLCFWLPTITYRSLWRCPTCKVVHQTQWRNDASYLGVRNFSERELKWDSRWGESDHCLKLWKEAGGAE
jgi:hypothetical protein